MLQLWIGTQWAAKLGDASGGRANHGEQRLGPAPFASQSGDLLQPTHGIKPTAILAIADDLEAATPELRFIEISCAGLVQVEAKLRHGLQSNGGSRDRELLMLDDPPVVVAKASIGCAAKSCVTL